jgi:hypothetical protein
MVRARAGGGKNTREGVHGAFDGVLKLLGAALMVDGEAGDAHDGVEEESIELEHVESVGKTEEDLDEPHDDGKVAVALHDGLHGLIVFGDDVDEVFGGGYGESESVGSGLKHVALVRVGHGGVTRFNWGGSERLGASLPGGGGSISVNAKEGDGHGGSGAVARADTEVERPADGGAEDGRTVRRGWGHRWSGGIRVRFTRR